MKQASDSFVRDLDPGIRRDERKGWVSLLLGLALLLSPAVVQAADCRDPCEAGDSLCWAEQPADAAAPIFDTGRPDVEDVRAYAGGLAESRNAAEIIESPQGWGDAITAIGVNADLDRGSTNAVLRWNTG